MVKLKRRIKELIVFMSVLLMSLLSSCSQKANSSTMSQTEDTSVNQSAIVINDESDKIEITIGVLSDNPIFKEAVVAFNKSDPNYVLTVIDYSDSGKNKSQEDILMELNNSLMTGSSLDIFMLSPSVDISNYVEMGLIEDLYPYLEQGRVKKEDILSKIIEQYTYEGLLATLPSTFALETYLAKESLVGKVSEWRPEDVLRLTEEHPDGLLYNWQTRDDELAYFILFNQNTFVDYDKKECYFNDIEFQHMLEHVKALPETQESIHYINDYIELLQNEKLLSLKVSFVDPDYFVTYKNLFGDEQVTCLGYPSYEQRVTAILTNCNGLYAMNAQSEHKEGAWTFLEQYLFGELTDRVFDLGFPIETIRFDQMLENSLTSKAVLTSATEEDLELIRTILKDAKRYEAYNYSIGTIIAEESLAYLADQNDIDNTITIIQNRVQNYLNEQ